MRKYSLIILAVILISTNTRAAEATVNLVKINSVAIVNAKLGLLHQIGNMEFQIDYDGQPEHRLSCDKYLITTLKAIDSDRSMLSLLLAARTNELYVTLEITDDPNLTAYPGRCSLRAVNLRKSRRP